MSVICCAIGLAQAHDDRIFVAALAELRRRACRPRWSGWSWRRRSPSGRAWRPSGDRRGWPAPGRAWSRPAARRRCPASSASSRDRVGRDAARVVDVVAADLERQARVLAAVENLVQLEVAAAGRGADDDAGKPGELAAQVLRDLIVRARALFARRRSLTCTVPRLVWPPPPNPPPPPPPLVRMVVISGTACRTMSSSRIIVASVISTFVPSGELGVDVDLAFVGLRQQLDADQRIQHDGQDDQRRPRRR